MRRCALLTVVFAWILALPMSLASPEPTFKQKYPWKKDIMTTEFWIGESGSTASAWDKNWVSSNSGNDSPTNRHGYLPADHASTVNPFYVALPFNDLAYPDKAHRWLPKGWERQPRDGKQVSACKDRWIEIKNEQGTICYAQWEDVGPLRHDHAEYVFGNERPGPGASAGLDVSPAVAKYLSIAPEGNNRLTSWRFVDAEEVPPGYWLKYDEEAILYTALHHLHQQGISTSTPSGPDVKNTATPPKTLQPASSNAAPAPAANAP